MMNVLQLSKGQNRSELPGLMALQKVPNTTYY